MPAAEPGRQEDGMGRERATRSGTSGVLVAVLAVVLAVAACGGDDEPDISSPSSIQAGPSTTAAGTTALRLTSAAFTEGQAIPSTFTCDGDNVPPPLEWTGVPDGAAELVLVVEDPDAERAPFVHWIVYRLPPAAGRLEAGSLSVQAVEGENGMDRIGYSGPCPPRGDLPHRYVFTLSAVGVRLDLPGGASAADVNEALEGNVVARATLTGTYER